MLPVLEIEQQIVAHLASSKRLVLSAPTGSGKTTQVPQVLLRSGLIVGQIIVLQPRRLATRMVARRVAQEVGCELGTTVGYQTRHDSKVSDTTRIHFMTEGLFLRLLQSNPTLSGIGVVILDEFHERSLDADMSLGLLRTLQDTGRSTCRLVVMSATLDVQAVGAYLGCPVLEAGGRLFPVEISYLSRRSQAPIWEQAAQALRGILESESTASGDEGITSGDDVLIFMPGVYEIRKTIDACRRNISAATGPVGFFPLHGSLPAHEQDAVLAPFAGRKVVVATNVAQTSLTIEGIRHVIDSGLARVHQYDARRGINVLRIEPISRAAADQRAGRAGRTGPGTCTRLWTKPDHHQRAAHDVPEVRRLDLAQCALQLKALGGYDISQFPWLDPPDPQAVQRAGQLLVSLQALDTDGKLTRTGRTMARFPMHPRLSRMLMEASTRRCLERAALWAALIGEQEIAAAAPKPEVIAHARAQSPVSDLVVLEELFTKAEQGRFNPRVCADLGLRPHACRDAHLSHRSYLDLCRRSGMNLESGGQGAKPQAASGSGVAELIKCLLVAFPDHVAMKLDHQRPHCALSGHKRVALDPASAVSRAGPVLALDIRQVGRGDTDQTVLGLASELDSAWLSEIHPDRVQTSTITEWNPQALAVEQVEQRTFDGLVFDRTARPNPDPAAAADILVREIQEGRLRLDRWDESVEQWIARVRCVAQWFPDRRLIGYDPADVQVILHEIVVGATRFNQVKDRPCLEALRSALSWEDQRFVEQMAPEKIELPVGYRMKVEYQPGAAPRGRAKIQDFYGLKDSPRVAGGTRKVLLEILGPNHRPLQVTDDLAGFWTNLYPTLRNELKRRYPRHEWR